MPQGSGTGSKAAYRERGGNRAAEKRESEGMGAESEWDKGTDGGTDCKEAITTELSFALYGRESMLE